ncbi:MULTISPECIES: iron-containing alcohol dehydrogenase [Marinobacter]|uniref:Iron-containing alcohol dehydrogenase n=1 Tax=Marinobacter xiaoshiensis TaxID=3073652 RepID=A0ABU2HF19_9GAMM|nr:MULTISPECIES: iron-containing alcohol dehydrogenase [unclassified Marinobacter]MBK1885103.1 iron-containing alcohol dehydrogenase [Marinobacter sp. DY40_1A1]MDS1309221.1 iron-containing alcohol dehydrogenase [Marinobacter sp. F60267]
MLGTFSLVTPTEILFGRGFIDQLNDRAAKLGSRALIVHGKNPGRLSVVFKSLTSIDIVQTLTIEKEPDLNTLTAAIDQGKSLGVDLVLGIGGGSVMDSAKVLAAMLPSHTDLLSHLEVVGSGLPLSARRLPLILVPTTSGTGAEVTRNAVIDVVEAQRKVSLRDNQLLPDLALVDPALTDNCPKQVSLYSGLDAVTQVIEPYLSSRSNLFTDMLCKEAIPKGLLALKQLMEGESKGARDALAQVSLFGGLALANSGLGVVHGIAGPLGSLCGAPHGAICGALLPAGIAANRDNVVEAGHKARVDDVIRWIAEVFEVSEGQALQYFREWIAQNGLPGLASIGVTEEHILSATQAAVGASSMKANPVVLPTEIIENVMRQSL